MSPQVAPEPFRDETPGNPSVRGYLHRADAPSSSGLVLTHSAGGNCNSALLVTLSEAFCAAGVTVLRCDLPFRQKRAQGPPMGTSELDQEGLERAAYLLRDLISGPLFVGGHSYGGRMATMLAARESAVADGLLLLSYPLHPPRKPQQLRTAHFPKLNTRALFVHGTRDSFGSHDEMRSALELIPTEKKLVAIEGAGHELLRKTEREQVLQMIVQEFRSFFLQKLSSKAERGLE